MEWKLIFKWFIFEFLSQFRFSVHELNRMESIVSQSFWIQTNKEVHIFFNNRKKRNIYFYQGEQKEMKIHLIYELVLRKIFKLFYKILKRERITILNRFCDVINDGFFLSIEKAHNDESDF